MINDTTIAAIATAHAASGVAVIRISGSDALNIASKMFKPSAKISVCDFEPYRLYPGTISALELDDFGMCVYFKAPKSFTGEDTVEFHSHGGVAISNSVLEKALSLGARMATRGEFTKRAFLNGKLSLSSCEGLVDMINAESLGEAKCGSYLYREKLFNKIKDYQAELKNILASVEVEIDYPEEVNVDVKTVINRLNSLQSDLSALASTYKSASKIKTGIKVAIVGAPNAGKSSVLNALINCEKAIVSPIQGTTRDIVEGETDICGVRFLFFDTAGIRESVDSIEKIGIERAFTALRSADVVLNVIDGLSPMDAKSLKLELDGLEVITVVNKNDISSSTVKADLQISALSGENIDKLKQLLYERAGLISVDLNGDFVTEHRHYEAILDALSSVNSALNALESMPIDVVTLDLEQAFVALGEISGESASEAVIDEIFSKFCVGK